MDGTSVVRVVSRSERCNTGRSTTVEIIVREEILFLAEGTACSPAVSTKLTGTEE